MEMKQNNHFAIAGLVESMLDVIVKYINFISTYRCVTKTVGMSFQNSNQSLLHNVWTDIEVLKFGISLT